MDSILFAKEAECRSLRGELSRRDSVTQRMEIQVFSLDQGLKHRDEELDYSKNEVLTLEQKLIEATTAVSEARKKLETERNDRRETEAKALELTNLMIEKQKKVLEKDLERLKNELKVCQLECKMLTEDRGLSSAKIANLEAEVEKRTRQAQDAAQKILDLKAKNAKLREKISEEKLPDLSGQIQKELNELRINSEATILSLETKLEQKRAYISQLEEEKSNLEKRLQDEVRKLKLELDSVERRIRDKENDFTGMQHQLVLKTSEIDSFRERIGTETPRKVGRRSSREDLLVHQVQRLNKQMEEMKNQQDQGSDNQPMLEEVVTLRTAKSCLDSHISDLERKMKEIESELEHTKSEKLELKDEVDTLTRILDDKDNDKEIVHNYLLDDISKVKQQKAEMRVKLMELQRQYAKLEQQKTSERKHENEAEIQQLKEVIWKQKAEERSGKRELTELRASLEQKSKEVEEEKLRKRVETLERELKHSSDASETCIERLKSQLKKVTMEKQALSSACVELDKQCNELEERRDKYKRKLDELTSRNEDMSKVFSGAVEELAKLKSQKEMMEREKNHLERKAQALQEELEATHVDYKEELAQLSKQIRTEMAASQDHADQLFALETARNGLETDKRKLMRELEQAQHEKNRLLSETDALSERLTEVCEKAATLEDALTVAVDKGERYKSERDDLSTQLELAQRERDEEKLRMEATISQQEKLVEHLQNQMATPSKKKGWALLTPSASQTTAGGLQLKDVQEMLTEERRTAAELRNQVKKLHSLLKEEQTKVYRMQSSSLGPIRPMSALSKRDSFTVSSDGSGATKGSAPGTMRHNIPHKWRRFFLLKPNKCIVCMDGLHVARFAVKCSECHIVVHCGCSETLYNTCGLPMLYTDYYRQQEQNNEQAKRGGAAVFAGSKGVTLHETPSAEGRMTGWVKLFRTNYKSQKWIDSWGYMDESKLAFYSKEDVTSEPIEELSLATQRWKIHFQRGVEPQDAQSVKSEDVPYLVEIKVTPENGGEAYRLYLMAPTFPAKQRWVNALQVATNRRMFARRLSSLKLQQNSYLRLDEPHNLNINYVSNIDGKEVLLGCEEGLYFTDMKKPSIPDKIAGIGEVFQLEVLQETDMVVVIAGKDRKLGFIHLGELCQSIRANHPGVKVTLTDMILCHLFLCIKWRAQSYLCVADPDKVHIMTFSSKLQIFTPHKEIETSTPTACMTQAEGSLIIGADRFYRVDLFSGQCNEFLDAEDPSVNYAAIKAPRRQDYPVDAVFLRNTTRVTEILLSYQNFALYVDMQGRRSRRNEIDWIRSPLDFAYSAPYLYVIHFESVEIFEIPSYDGPETSAIEPMSLLDVASPKLLGQGISQSEVFIGSSRINSTEILLLNTNQSGDRMVSKRKNNGENKGIRQNEEKKMRPL